MIHRYRAGEPLRRGDLITLKPRPWWAFWRPPLVAFRARHGDRIDGIYPPLD